MATDAYTIWLERLTVWTGKQGTIAAAATKLGVTYSKLYGWLKRGIKPDWPGARITEPITRVRAEVLFDALYI